MPILIIESGPSSGTRFAFDSSAVVGRVPPAESGPGQPDGLPAACHAPPGSTTPVRRGPGQHQRHLRRRPPRRQTHERRGRIARPVRRGVRIRYYEDAAVPQRAGRIPSAPSRTIRSARTSNSGRCPPPRHRSRRRLPLSASADASDSMADLADRLQVLDDVAPIQLQGARPARHTGLRGRAPVRFCRRAPSACCSCCGSRCPATCDPWSGGRETAVSATRA